MFTEQKQEQKYCCYIFEYCIKDGIITTKEQAFKNGKNWRDQEFYKMHPRYIMWIENKDPMKSVWTWFHFCPNCGFKHSTDDEIKYWNEYITKNRASSN